MAWLEKRDGTWYIAFRDQQGRTNRLRPSTDKLVAKGRLADFEKAQARGEDYSDPFKDHRGRAIAEHVKDCVADLRAKGRSAKYVENTENRLGKLIEACGWKVLADVTADSFLHWRQSIPVMADGRAKIGPVTQNQYLETAFGFCRWCVKPAKRMPANPLADVEKVDESRDVRRARRALAEGEIAKLLSVVPEHHKPAYRLILATGLRRHELETLQWGDLHLDATRPYVKLRAKVTKSRRADALPLRDDTATELRSMKGEARDGDRVFTDLPTMDEHRAYLAAAGIDWLDDEGRRADLHAMRHTYGTLLSKAGVSPREAMELMRHTDLRLTMKVYTDPRIFDLAAAVAKLPLPPVEHKNAAAATGTDGGPIQQTTTMEQVANRVAIATLDRQSVASTGNQDDAPYAAVNPDDGGDWQQKTLTGLGEGSMGAVGFEPTKAEPPDLQSGPFDHFGTRPVHHSRSRLGPCPKSTIPV